MVKKVQIDFDDIVDFITTDIRDIRDEGIQFTEKIIVLKCSEKENRHRAEKDGRDSMRIERGMKNTFSFYDRYEYSCIDTTDMTSNEVAEKIIKMM